MTEEQRNWPPPPKTLTDAMRGLAPPQIKARQWLSALALTLALAGVLLSVWLLDWRWLVTGVVAYLAVCVASALDVSARKRKAGQ